MGKRILRQVGRGLLILTLFVPPLAHADFAEDAGIGTATVLANILYMPTKLVYATLGGVTGGFAYLLTGGNYSAAETVWVPSLGGNYVLNPEHIRGQEQIYFSGPVPEARNSYNQHSYNRHQ